MMTEFPLGVLGIRATVLAEQITHPDAIFVGSFGAGGKKVDEYGTLSDGLTACARASVCLVKNTWPVPEFKEGAKFVFGVDGGPNALEGAWLLRRLIKPHDSLECVVVCSTETSREREAIERLKTKLASARDKADETPVTYNIIRSESISKDGIARTLCSYAQRADADFLVVGSQGPEGARNKRASGAIPFGQVSAICANISRTHFICMKPEFVGQEATTAQPVGRMKRSGSFMGKVQMMGGGVLGGDGASLSLPQ
mmetsp:Transcript_39820/g.93455  ORF Transcript_39820/g.93455 Transcript_39820/m.93455 type:complete len:256 (+) Transcript_39820:298-1065(+)